MQRIGRWVALAVTIAVMVLIFCLSAQDGDTSGTLSNTVLTQVRGTSVQQVTPGWFSKNDYANIRKWAHVYVYCALGASTAATACLWLAKRTAHVQAAAAAAVCLVYAVGDELHQYFVPGRAMLAGDVAIDAAGFVPCILLVCLLFWLGRRHTEHKKH